MTATATAATAHPWTPQLIALAVVLAVVLALYVIVRWPVRPVAPRPVPYQVRTLGPPPADGGADRPLPSVLVIGTDDVEPLMPRVLPDDVFVVAGPGVVSHEGRMGGFDVRTASLRGLDHGDAELAEDAGVVCADGDVLLLAVADGVGSQAGSVACAVAAVQGLRRGFRSTPSSSPEVRLQAAFNAAVEAAAAASTREGSGACALACALVVRGEQLVVHAAAVGDSRVQLLVPGHGLVGLVGAGEADGTTRALPRDVQPVVDVVAVPGGTAVLVMSDGFDEGLSVPGSQLRERVETGWRTPPPEFHVLADASFRGDYFYDDRTVVAAWPAM